MCQPEIVEGGLLGFYCAGRNFEAPVAEVERVLTLPAAAVSPMPFGLNDRITGIFSFRGVIYPLARIAGITPELQSSSDLTVILFNADGKIFGLPVDSVGSVEETPCCKGRILVRAETLYSGGPL